MPGGGQRPRAKPAGPAQAHPSYDGEADREIGQFLAEWALPENEVRAGLDAGMQLDFDRTVQELLDSSA
jgi:hypothetical protein